VKEGISWFDSITWRTCISTSPIPHPKPELNNQEYVTAERQSRKRAQIKTINKTVVAVDSGSSKSAMYLLLSVISRLLRQWCRHGYLLIVASTARAHNHNILLS